MRPAVDLAGVFAFPPRVCPARRREQRWFPEVQCDCHGSAMGVAYVHLGAVHLPGTRLSVVSRAILHDATYKNSVRLQIRLSGLSVFPSS